MNILKEASVEANKAWKSAGKPRHGTIFHIYLGQNIANSLRRSKFIVLKFTQTTFTKPYIAKENYRFWQCWRSTFEFVNNCSHVQGCMDPDIVANKFAMNFQKTISCNDPHQADALKLSYGCPRQLSRFAHYILS